MEVPSSWRWVVVGYSWVTGSPLSPPQRSLRWATASQGTCAGAHHLVSKLVPVEHYLTAAEVARQVGSFAPGHRGGGRGRRVGVRLCSPSAKPLGLSAGCSASPAPCTELLSPKLGLGPGSGSSPAPHPTPGHSGDTCTFQKHHPPVSQQAMHLISFNSGKKKLAAANNIWVLGVLERN